MSNNRSTVDRNGERSFSNNIDGRLWQIVMAALVAGGVGGFGFRQIDPSAFTKSEGQDLKYEIRQLKLNDRAQDIKLGQLPPTKLLLQINQHEFRLQTLEKDHKAYKAKEKNVTQSHGK